MKRFILLLMLCLAGISLISWRNPFSSSNTQNVNVKVSEEYADWVEVGTVQLHSNKYGGHPCSTNSVWTVNLWVRIVGNVRYYKVGRKIESAVSPTLNPNYKDDPKQLKYMVDLFSVTRGTTCYLNLPE